jgi:hypothetical protein
MGYGRVKRVFREISRFDDLVKKVPKALTGSATRKPRLIGGDKGRNKKLTTSLPGSPALWAGSFNLGRLRI